MGKQLTWVSGPSFSGWTCSQCKWNYSVPELLSDPEARAAYDRLASAKFQSHNCADHGSLERPAEEDDFTQRARKLIHSGLKPRDAVDIAMKEILFESHNTDPKFTDQLRTQGDDFLRRVKQGLL